jgi:hypothetical protein
MNKSSNFFQIKMISKRSGKIASAPAADADLKQITAYTPWVRSGSGVKAGGCGVERVRKFFDRNTHNV